MSKLYNPTIWKYGIQKDILSLSVGNPLRNVFLFSINNVLQLKYLYTVLCPMCG